MIIHAEEWKRNVKTHSTQWPATGAEWRAFKAEKIRRAKAKRFASVIDFTHDKFSIIYMGSGEALTVNYYTKEQSA